MLLFLPLIIPPAAAGGIVKIAFLRGLSFFVFNYPTPGGGGIVKIVFLRDLSFLTLIIPPPGGGGVNKDCLPVGPFFFCA